MQTSQATAIRHKLIVGEYKLLKLLLLDINSLSVSANFLEFKSLNLELQIVCELGFQNFNKFLGIVSNYIQVLGYKQGCQVTWKTWKSLENGKNKKLNLEKP